MSATETIAEKAVRAYNARECVLIDIRCEFGGQIVGSPKAGGSTYSWDVYRFSDGSHLAMPESAGEAFVCNGV